MKNTNIEKLEKEFDEFVIENGIVFTNRENYKKVKDFLLHAYSQGVKDSLEVVEERYYKIKEDAKFTQDDGEDTVMKKMAINHERQTERNILRDVLSSLTQLITSNNEEKK